MQSQLPKPRKQRIQDYQCEGRKGKDGLYTVYYCNFCQYRLHDYAKVVRHQQNCQMKTSVAQRRKQRQQKQDLYAGQYLKLFQQHNLKLDTIISLINTLNFPTEKNTLESKKKMIKNQKVQCCFQVSKQQWLQSQQYQQQSQKSSRSQKEQRQKQPQQKEQQKQTQKRLQNEQQKQQKQEFNKNQQFQDSNTQQKNYSPSKIQIIIPIAKRQ